MSQLPEPDETGNGITAVEWRAWVARELRGVRSDFRTFHEKEFTPVRDHVLRQQGRDSFIEKGSKFLGPTGFAIALVALLRAFGGQ